MTCTCVVPPCRMMPPLRRYQLYSSQKFRFFDCWSHITKEIDLKAHTEVNWVATIAGRIGYAFDRALIYAKGGYTNQRLDLTASNGTTETGGIAYDDSDDIDGSGRAPRVAHYPGARAKSFRAWAARFLLPVIEGQL